MIPLIPSGSFFSTFYATIFWINYSFLIKNRINEAFVQLQKRLFFLVILINLIASVLYVKNFDQNIIVDNKYKNLMIKSDIASYNLNAAKILNNLKNKEKIFNQEYYRSFLPQIIIALYYGISNQEIIENQYSLDVEKEKEIVFKTNNGKTGFFILQILVYFIAIYFFYIVLLNHFPKNYSLIVLGFLSIESAINQYHSSFFTESVYISLNIVLLSLTLLKKKKCDKNWQIYNLALGHEEQKKFFYQSNESSSSGFNSLNTKSNYYKKKKLVLNFFSLKKK
jgi:hypothetical protein